MADLSDEELAALKAFAVTLAKSDRVKPGAPTPFSATELNQLRELLKIQEEIHQYFTFKMARRVVLQTYRQAILALAGIISAGIVVWAAFKDSIKGLFG